ncbi:MAG: GGDEF domain-containing protein, partial [Actinomycetota bacterium]|nr:GGDEF domain-containing protein [Actinomycetota bacterium]
PTLSYELCYVIGYLPLLLGLADLSDPQLRTRRLTNVVDGVLLFLVLYAVLWLMVVEHVTVDTSLPKLDRAFSALYPAGDLAVVMLSVRIVFSHAARRRVGLLLLLGAVLTAAADVSLLVLYLHNPDGAYQLPDLAYLCGLGAIALAAVWSLLPAPPPVPTGARSSRVLAITVALSALVPPLVLGGIVLFTDRHVEMLPVAVWVLLAVCAAVMRHLASVRELERAHQKSIWLASHDLGTDTLGRAAFMHELSEGSMRDRAGSIVVVEILGLDELRDAQGYDAVDHVVATVAQRLRTAASDDGVMARLAHDQFALFLRSADLARGRQVAASLQKGLTTGVGWGTVLLALPAVVGVAQADGAVIDAGAGVRRAIDALRMGRVHGAGYVAIDADLTGSPQAMETGAHPSAHLVVREPQVHVAG